MLLLTSFTIYILHILERRLRDSLKQTIVRVMVKFDLFNKTSVGINVDDVRQFCCTFWVR